MLPVAGPPALANGSIVPVMASSRLGLPGPSTEENHESQTVNWSASEA